MNIKIFTKITIKIAVLQGQNLNIRLKLHFFLLILDLTLAIFVRYQSVMRIPLNYYSDPDPGSRNPPYKSGSGSKEKPSHKIQLFQNFVEKSILSY